MRKLASIQRILEINPIEGSDRIEYAKILGWRLIVKKDEFKVGDLCVYCEIDSILPEKPEFEFLRSKKFRIKTLKMRGAISQGIAFRIQDVLPSGNYKEDQDVTEIIGVKKHDPELESISNDEEKYIPKKNPILNKLSYWKFLITKFINKHLYKQDKAGKFPEFLQKTDETRIQNLQRQLTSNKGIECYITEKAEGSSTTFFIKDRKFGVCSRNMKVGKHDIRWKIAKKYGIEKILRSYGKDIAIQCELIGPKIQKNIYKLAEPDIRVFSLYLINENRYSTFQQLIDFVERSKLPLVPIIEKSFNLIDDIDAIVEMSKGDSKLYPTKREGIVIRSKDFINEQIFSCKAINPDYLLSQAD